MCEVSKPQGQGSKVKGTRCTKCCKWLPPKQKGLCSECIYWHLVKVRK